jgi:conjugal transfer pilus assembly protein TraV
MPVFQQPKVVRVWIAPFVDANGNLHSGEYQYFSTPGHWNYGSLKAPGQASGMFQPSMPGDYGFNPVTKTETTNAPPAPPINAPANQTVKAAGSEEPGGITQPYQKLVPPQ